MATKSIKISKSEQEANEKSEKILEGIAAWTSFYRENPQRFAKDYLNVSLKLFQKILIYHMIHNNHFMMWACRSLGKTWLSSLFTIIRCILYPGTKICVASATRPQANEILSKIIDDFMKNYGWGSENLRREISYDHVGTNEAVIKFHNGSWIKVVTASDSGRGNRANILLLDEFRMLDKNTIDLVLKRFLGAPRQPHYLTLKEYKNRPDLLEYNAEIYLSSAWFKSHWSYQKAKSYMANYLTGRRGYYICWLPYQLAILSGLKKREEIEDEMSEIDFDQAAFDMEMGCLPVGDTDGSFFKFDDIDKSRKLKTAMYLSNAIVKQTKIPDLAENERRILSVDVALMASKTHKNDAACIILNSAIPKSNDTYSANIVFLENFEGLKTEELALTVRRMFDKFKCTDLVLDTAGQGLGIYDAISSDIVDYETGEVYPALSCCNDTAMAERCKVDNAPKVIWSVKASAAFNSQAAITLRSGFQNNRINLLVSEFEADDILGDKVKGYSKMATVDQAHYKMPYVQTTLLVYELIALECEVNGTNVKVIEKSGKRKDRYSSLAYNYWVQCQLERETLKKKEMGFDITGFTKCLKSLTHKPTFY